MPFQPVTGVCHECEGMGRAVNYFDIPDSIFCERKFRDCVIPAPTRSDGRSYTSSPCRVCGGSGHLHYQMTSGGALLPL